MLPIQLIIANKKNEARVKQEIEHCYAHVKMFKRRLDELGITPDDFKGVEDLNKFPTFEKKDFRKHFPVGVFAGSFKLNDPRLTRSPSSGTSGDRLMSFEFGTLLLDRAVQCSSHNPSIEAAFTAYPRRHIRYAAPNCSDVECANPNSKMEDRLLEDGTLILPVYHDLLTTPERMLDTALDEIAQYQPNLYYIDATHFAFLMRHAKKREFTPPPAPIIATFSNVTRIAKAQINRVFGENSVKQLVSMSEFGWTAMECEHGHLHLNTQSFVFEFLNLQGEPAQPGELAEIVITSIDQGAIPHFRYKTGDTYRLQAQPCACGNPSPTVTFEGRKSDLMFINNEAGETVVSPSDIDRAIDVPTGLALYQFIREGENQFALKVITEDDWSAQEESTLKARLLNLLGADANLRIEHVPYIDTDRSGKFRTCIPTYE